MRLFIAFFVVILLPSRHLTAQEVWEFLGPEGGPVGALRVHRLDSQLVYATTRSGLFRSRDGGQNWDQVYAKRGSTLLQLEMDHSMPPTVYLSTTTQLFRSMDGGETWLVAGGEDTRGFFSLTIDAVDSNVLFGVDGSELLRSSDQGESWEEIGPNFIPGWDSVRSSATAEGVLVAVTEHKEVFYSSDSGDTWTPLTALRFLSDAPVSQRSSQGWRSSSVIYEAIDVEVDPGDPERVYILGGRDLYRVRSQQDFEQMPLPAFTASFSPISLHLSPVDPETIYVYTSGGLCQSRDRGQSWEVHSGMISQPVGVDPSHSQVLYMTTNTQLRKSVDGGRSYVELRSGLQGRWVEGLVQSPYNPQVLVAGGNGLFRSADGGRSWQGRSTSWIDRLWPSPKGSFDYFRLYFGRLYESDDQGDSWFTDYFHYGTTLYSTTLRAFAASPSDPFVLYANSRSRFFRSRDGGSNWEETEATYPRIPFSARWLAVDPVDPDVVYGTEIGIWKSSDAGDSFERIGLEDEFLLFVAVDPSNTDLIYASGKDGLTTYQHWRSSDAGQSWQSIAGLSDKRMSCMVFDGAIVYAGFDGAGIYRSQDSGLTWAPFDEGLHHPGVNALVLLDGAGKSLYAGTEGGVFRRILEQPPAAPVKVEKSVSGNSVLRSSLDYKVTLRNLADSVLPDTASDEYVDTLPSNLQLLDASADLGRLRIGPDGDSIAWNGELAPGQPVEIHVRARIFTDPVGIEVGSQGVLRADLDGDGQFDASALSDDPATAAPDDPTVIIPDRGFDSFFAVPASTSIDDTFMGVALANFWLEPTPLRIRGWDQSGRLTSDEVGLHSIAPHGQLAITATQSGAGQAAMIGFEGVEAPISGYFMPGDSSSDRLDGIGAPLRQAQQLFFGEVLRTSSATTRIFLFNPDGANSAQMSLQLFDAQGRLQDQANAALPANGSLQANLEELFGEDLQLDDGYIEIKSDRPLQGFELVAASDSFTTHPARLVRYVDRMWVPHYFFNDAQGTTVIRVLNPRQESLRVTVRAMDDDQGELGEAGFEVEGRHVEVLDVRELAPAGQFDTGNGFLEIRLAQPGESKPGLAGAVISVIYDGGQLGTRAALPLPVSRRSRSDFLQVAQSRELGIFQGVAVFNPTPKDDAAYLTATSADGQTRTYGSFQVPAFSRAVKLLSDEGFYNSGDVTFGPGFEQIGGTLRVESGFGRPGLIVIALFGGPRFLASLQAIQD